MVREKNKALFSGLLFEFSITVSQIKYMYMLKMHIYADVYIDMSVSMWSKSGSVFSQLLLVFTITAFMCNGKHMCIG